MAGNEVNPAYRPGRADRVRQWVPELIRARLSARDYERYERGTGAMWIPGALLQVADNETAMYLILEQALDARFRVIPGEGIAKTIVRRIWNIRKYGYGSYGERVAGDPGFAAQRAAIEAKLHADRLASDVFYRIRWSGPCVYCGAGRSPQHGCGTFSGRWTSTDALDCDHIRPFALGGTDDEDNLVPACRPCNASKARSLLIDWKHQDRVAHGVASSPKVAREYARQLAERQDLSAFLQA